MHDRAPQQQRADIRAEKVRRLSQLVADSVSSAAGDGASGPLKCMVIAKSEKSAAVAAVKRAREIAGLHAVSVRILFVGSGECSAWSEAVSGDDIQALQHPGLLEVHERLIVGDLAVWTGDSIRRAPDKIDGFESLETDAPSVLWACRSFEKLWQMAMVATAGATPQIDEAPLAAAQLSPRQVFSKSFGSSDS